jgi:hypothetical protein
MRIDGLGDPLGAAYGIVEKGRNTAGAKVRVTVELRPALEGNDKADSKLIREVTTAPVGPIRRGSAREPVGAFRLGRGARRCWDSLRPP